MDLNCKLAGWGHDYGYRAFHLLEWTLILYVTEKREEESDSLP